MSTKTLFITGASSGIGAATARLAVAKGWHVGLFARTKDKLDALAGELGEKALVLPGDVTDLDTQKAAIATFVERTGWTRLSPMPAWASRPQAPKRAIPKNGSR